jgi:hypothetical protein
MIAKRDVTRPHGAAGLVLHPRVELGAGLQPSAANLRTDDDLAGRRNREEMTLHRNAEAVFTAKMNRTVRWGLLRVDFKGAALAHAGLPAA